MEQATGNREHAVFPKCSQNMFRNHSGKTHPWNKPFIPVVVKKKNTFFKKVANSIPILSSVAGPIFETKNRAIFLERLFGRGIPTREQLSRAKKSLDFK